MKKLRIALFWILSLTWGLPGTLAGALGAAVELIKGSELRLYHGNVCIETSRAKGSLSLGPFIFLSKAYTPYTRFHEAGHGIQNIIYGPLYLIIVGLTSITWYHIYNKIYREKIAAGLLTVDEQRKNYEKWWVEKQATEFGRKIYYSIDQKEQGGGLI
ncbi:MAG: hypothetical protein LBQ40_01145 [Clostridiales bacterium]|jgi:hypothetical protein|nr:hypothetical protein [Clostridiales bacterium]